jgi:MFS family permease
MALAVLVIANDFTALSVAIPSIEATFHADMTTSQWVINGYALVFGVFIVTGGRLADMFGRRRAFFLGCAIFSVFSLVGGVAPSVAVLLGARALMGIGGALMWPPIMGHDLRAPAQGQGGARRRASSSAPPDSATPSGLSSAAC